MINRSRRPHHAPNTKVGKQEEQLILILHKTRNLGARRIQSELKRLHEFSLSLATVHKVLQKHDVEPVKKYRRKTDYRRYACTIPGKGVRWTLVKSPQACTSTPLLMIALAIGYCGNIRAGLRLIRWIFRIVSSRKCRLLSSGSRQTGVASSLR